MTWPHAAPGFVPPRHVHAAAWLASSWRRDTILRAMGFVALAATAATSAALLQYEGTQQV